MKRLGAAFLLGLLCGIAVMALLPQHAEASEPPTRWDAQHLSVPVYYAGQGLDPSVVSAIQRAIPLWNAAGPVQLVDMGTAVSPAPCGQNFWYINVCSLTLDGATPAETGVGGYYVGLDTSVQYIQGVSTWVDNPVIQSWAEQGAALRYTSLGPDGGLGWTTQDMINMALCHELGHALRIPEMNDTGIIHGCIAGDTSYPSPDELSYVRMLYSLPAPTPTATPTSTPSATPTATPTASPTPTATPATCVQHGKSGKCR